MVLNLRKARDQRQLRRGCAVTWRTSSTEGQAPEPIEPFRDLTVFDGFEVHGVHTVEHLAGGIPVYAQCDDNEAEFFSLYGHYDATDFNNGLPWANVGLECLLDFTTRDQAELARAYFEHFRQGQLMRLPA